MAEVIGRPLCSSGEQTGTRTGLKDLDLTNTKPLTGAAPEAKTAQSLAEAAGRRGGKADEGEKGENSERVWWGHRAGAWTWSAVTPEHPGLSEPEFPLL